MKINLIGMILNTAGRRHFEDIILGEDGKPLEAEHAIDHMIMEYAKVRLGGESNTVVVSQQVAETAPCATLQSSQCGSGDQKDDTHTRILALETENTRLKHRLALMQQATRCHNETDGHILQLHHNIHLAAHSPANNSTQPETHIPANNSLQSAHEAPDSLAAAMSRTLTSMAAESRQYNAARTDEMIAAIRAQNDLHEQVHQLQKQCAAHNHQLVVIRKKLEKIASPTQTKGLLWWQIDAREALAVMDDAHPVTRPCICGQGPHAAYCDQYAPRTIGEPVPVLEDFNRCLEKISEFCPEDPTVDQLDESKEMQRRLHSAEVGDTARRALAMLGALHEKEVTGNG